MENSNLLVGKRIKDRRKELGISAEQLAEILDVHPSTIYRYENEDIANMRIDKIEPIAMALHVSASYLMGWDAASSPAAVQDLPELSPDERDLIDSFRALNQEGQEKVISYTQDLVSSGRYIKNSSPFLVDQA